MTNLAAWHGDSGDGKTSLLGSLVQWMIKNAPGKKCRLYSADNTDPLEPYIDAGLVEVWRPQMWDHPFETLDLACQGYWPTDPSDPTSKLVKPTAATWDTYRLLAYEGGSLFSDLLMQDLADRIGDGVRVGPGTRPGEDGISFKDGSYGVGGNTQTHYNIVQKEMRKNIRNTGNLPVQCVWTFHTVKAVEENKPIFGPQLAGKAATAKVQAWFGALLHCHTEPGKAGSIEYKLYLKEHYDKNVAPTIPFKAVTRVPLPLLDPAVKRAIEQTWDGIIPQSLTWTNDSGVMTRYMDLRKQLREAAKQIILNI
jgi:hypothetical protein